MCPADASGLRLPIPSNSERARMRYPGTRVIWEEAPRRVRSLDQAAALSSHQPIAKSRGARNGARRSSAAAVRSVIQFIIPGF